MLTLTQSSTLWKTPGIDQITAEVLKAGGKPMVDMLHKIAGQKKNHQWIGHARL